MTANERAEALYRAQRSEVHRHTDRLFAGLMVFQWLAGIAVALWCSAETWAVESSFGPRPRAMWAALLGAVLILPSVLLGWRRTGAVATRHVVAATQMLFWALYVHVTEGRVEMRFHLLASLALLAFYRDWRVLVTASAVAVLSLIPSWGAWRSWEPLAWVAFIDVFLLRACVLGDRGMRQAALAQTQMEQASRQRYEQLVGSVDGIVWEADARTFECILVSPQAERILGYPAERWLREPSFWKDLIDPEDRDRVLLSCATELAAGRAHEIEYRVRAADGRTLWIRHSVTVMGEDQGRSVFRGVLTDITERRKMERMKSEFISLVSHELRTPLTSIHGALGLLAGGMGGTLPARGKGLIDIAYRSSDRLVRLITDILDLDKMEAGRMSVALRPLALNPLIQQAVEANRPFGAKFEVDFVFESGPEEAQVRGDADRLTQVLTNLLSNAAKFSPRGGAVQVGVERRGSNLRISVVDHGPGIPENFRNVIFGKFAQADTSQVRKKGGSGLGLSIAKAIVERHGGRIGYDTAVGEGTTFWFELPEWTQVPVACGGRS